MAPTVKYVGDKEVLAVEVCEESTPLLGKIVNVKFADGSSQVLTEKMYQNVVSDTPCDLSALRDKRVTPIVKEILVLLRESNLRIDEVDYMCALLVSSINKSSEDASNKLWNVKDGGERTFLDIDEVLKRDDPTNK